MISFNKISDFQILTDYYNKRTMIQIYLLSSLAMIIKDYKRPLKIILLLIFISFLWSIFFFLSPMQALKNDNITQLYLSNKWCVIKDHFSSYILLGSLFTREQAHEASCFSSQSNNDKYVQHEQDQWGWVILWNWEKLYSWTPRPQIRS